jgi:hypothetical protein
MIQAACLARAGQPYALQIQVCLRVTTHDLEFDCDLSGSVTILAWAVRLSLNCPGYPHLA